VTLRGERTLSKGGPLMAKKKSKKKEKKTGKQKK
jgi:hypothetical protein